MSITLKQAKGLRHGQVLYHAHERDSQNRPVRWRVNGKPKVWKRNPERVRVPIKHGMYDYDYLEEGSLDLVSLIEREVQEG